MSSMERRKLIVAISAFWNLIMICVDLGMEVMKLTVIFLVSNRLGRQPLDDYEMKHYDRQRVIYKCTKMSDTESHRKIRMNRTLFTNLCDLLAAEGGLKRTRNIEIDEMVLTFLLTISHSDKNRS
ncbi:unnamed protein product [Linum trigynum]|uniref:DUF8040 domain-containing protein n=1 Tax=Linum trigynum TaxID=586398 RepID=A0AAV2FCI4_9ROSI